MAASSSVTLFCSVAVSSLQAGPFLTTSRASATSACDQPSSPPSASGSLPPAIRSRTWASRALSTVVPLLAVAPGCSLSTSARYCRTADSPMLVGFVPGRGTEEVGAAKAIKGDATAESMSVWLNFAPPVLPEVVAVMLALCGDCTAEASTAAAVKEYEVPAVRPLIVALVAVGLATTLLPSYTR